jgi:ureidoglycolate hydrolase
MPIEIGIVYETNIDHIELIKIKTKSNFFVINVDKEPKNVILDPNYWVLMNKDFKKKY